MKFYDTCSLLKKVDNLFDEGEFALYALPSATHNYTRHFGNKVLNQDYSKTETIVNCR